MNFLPDGSTSPHCGFNNETMQFYGNGSDSWRCLFQISSPFLWDEMWVNASSSFTLSNSGTNPEGPCYTVKIFSPSRSLIYHSESDCLITKEIPLYGEGRAKNNEITIKVQISSEQSGEWTLNGNFFVRDSIAMCDSSSVFCGNGDCIGPGICSCPDSSFRCSQSPGGECVNDIDECSQSQCDCEEPFLCHDGLCQSNPGDCVTTGSQEEEQCWDGSISFHCPPVPACPDCAPIRFYTSGKFDQRCLNGTCVAEEDETCLVDSCKVLDPGSSSCPFGCKDEEGNCPPFNGCPFIQVSIDLQLISV